MLPNVHRLPIAVTRDPLRTTGATAWTDVTPRQKEERSLASADVLSRSDPNILAFNQTHAANVLRGMDLSQANPVFLRIFLEQRKT